MRLIVLFALLLPLAACGDPARTLVTSPPAPKITPPSPTSLAACAPPVVLPAGPATQKQVEIAWAVVKYGRAKKRSPSATAARAVPPPA